MPVHDENEKKRYEKKNKSATSMWLSDKNEDNDTKRRKISHAFTSPPSHLIELTHSWAPICWARGNLPSLMSTPTMYLVGIFFRFLFYVMRQYHNKRGIIRDMIEMPNLAPAALAA